MSTVSRKSYFFLGFSEFHIDARGVLGLTTLNTPGVPLGPWTHFIPTSLAETLVPGLASYTQGEHLYRVAKNLPC